MLDPLNQPQSFYFGRTSMGLSSRTDVRRLNLPKMRLPDSSQFRPESEGTALAGVETGTIFMTNAFMGLELNQSDLRGAAVLVHPGPDSEVLVGQRRTVLLLGIHSAELMLGLSAASTFSQAERAIAQARALMLIDGINPALPSDGLGVVLGYLN
ncbi:hypothetical protein QCE49_23745 [Caballeronia sp. LZ008]|uniref:hypothetical protein n=1 Tax=unclassified Caballeronia TaxID=2646786 RepID=UPI0020277DB6|nr:MULTISPECIES: hypothetical protein [unclassified Caballeronia]MDR5796402.1 hypothetical protein [Caballeronia sp. LZ008]